MPVQLALGRILEFGRVDAVVVPRPTAVYGDAWNEALCELLPRRIAGLPLLLDVPGDLSGVETAAAELGQRLVRQPGTVRSALEKVRPLAQPRRQEMPPLQRASRPTVGVIGPRTLLGNAELSAPLRQRLEQLGLHAVYAPDLPQALVAERGERLESSRAAAGDRALYGALRLLQGKGAVAGLLLVFPARDEAARAALSRLSAEVHKPSLTLEIEAGEHSWPELQALAEQLGAQALSPAPQQPSESGL
ncbi:hypothetical protein ACFP81_06750 [Deinococcus lacus]|uniref:Uncharacterized protein n=1 Tax=Deinococcus lacus TaxID=392561 RepID=A0ABW1YCG9_9DEIO